MITYPMYGINKPYYPNTNARIRPVASIEEVKASPIDFDGSVFYFHDVVNKKIYTKQINLEGMVQIDTYEIAAAAQPDQKELETANFVTQEEFQKAIQDITAKIKGETNNDEQQSVSANHEFHF